MSGINQPFPERADLKLLNQASNLAVKVDGNHIALGIAPAQVTQLETRVATFRAALNSHDAAVQSARAARLGKDAAASHLQTYMRELNRQVQGNPSVGNELKAEVGFPVREPRTIAKPNAPADLAATIINTGNFVLLTWKRNQNINGTQYFIQARHFGGAWQILDATLATRLEVPAPPPGAQVTYRAYAQRGARTSGFSNEATIWAGAEGDNTVNLEAA